MNEPLRAVIHRPAPYCFEAFCDVSQLRHWLPGLKRARVVRSSPDGRPMEVLFEYLESLSYSLVYRYEPALMRLSWVPALGSQEAVSGHATFAPHPEGCELIYSLQSGPKHGPPNAQRVIQAFARWVESFPMRPLET